MVWDTLNTYVCIYVCVCVYYFDIIFCHLKSSVLINIIRTYNIILHIIKHLLQQKNKNSSRPHVTCNTAEYMTVFEEHAISGMLCHFIFIVY